MGKRNQHVTKHPDGWQVKGAGNSKVIAVTQTQGQATEIAKEIANNNKSEVVIHRPDGTIRDSDP